MALAVALLGASYAHAAPAASGSDTLSALAWRNIGPFRGGRATAVAGIASEPFTFFMGAAGGGVWETTDAGVTWSNVSDGFLKTASVGAIAIAASDPKVIYVGMGEATARANTLHRGDGVYKSVDGGKTWSHIGLDTVDEISRILIDPHDPNRVYVAAQGPLYAHSQDRGVFRSADGGATWKRVLFTGDAVGPADLAMDPTNPRVLYAAMWDHLRTPWEIRAFGEGSGLYKSADGGDTWAKTDAGLPSALGKLSVATTADPNRVYALVATQVSEKSGLYRSDDAGKSWSLINNDRNLTRRSWYFLKVFADPTDPQTVWVADLAMHRSTDGGKTFAPVKPPHGDHHDLWINPTDARFVAEADDGGGTISLDGGRTWSSQDNQSTAQFYRIAADNAWPYHLYSGQQDDDAIAIASASFEPGGIGRQDWRPTAGNENSFVDVDPDHPDDVWASGYLGEMDQLTQSTGVTRVTSPYPVLLWGNSASRMQTYRYVLNTPILKSRHARKTLYLGAQMLLATDDDGKTWREVGPDVTRRGNVANAPQHLGTGETGDGAYGAIDYVAESPLKEGVLWTGSDDGMVAVTPDGGKTWRKSTLPGVPDARISAIDPSPHDPATAYVAATRFQFDDQKPYLFKTTDWGKTWTRLGADLPAWTAVVREDPARKGLLYAGTETGVFVSFDDGATWRSLQSKLPLTPISDLLVHDGDLIAATSGRGFWILDDLEPLRQFGGGEAVKLYRPRTAYRSSLGSGESSFDKAYGKNPPRGAILNFQLAAKGDADIDILDASGAVVRHLGADGSPGLNRLVWNLRETATPLIADGLVFGGGSPQGDWAPPGAYIVRLTAGGATQTQPLTIEAQPGTAAPRDAYLEQDRFLKQIDADLTAFHDPALLARDAHRQLETEEARITDPVLLADAKALSAKLAVDLEPYGDMAFLQVKNDQVVPVDQPTSRTLYEKLHSTLTAQIAALNDALGPQLTALNARLSAAALAPVQPKLPPEPHQAKGAGGEFQD
ncbi:MAG TPA: hypothetical protein VG407_08895 [Caulobacteraceae bacterium]|nr:hypothetical protein [Caulobacteraceae bacterium]